MKATLWRKSINDYAILHNPDLRQLDIGRMQLQKSLQLQKTQRMPALAAFSQYGYSGTGSKQNMIWTSAIMVDASKDSLARD